MTKARLGPPVRSASGTDADLVRDELHGSLTEPVMGALEFLNEIMERYPEAISFAPGAPHLEDPHENELAHCIQTFLEHLCRSRSLTMNQARRRLYEYGPSRGLINDLVAAALKNDFGMAVDPDALVITTGAQEGMLLALRALCRTPDDLLAVVDPSYVGITGAACLLGIPVLPLAEGPLGIDLRELEQACTGAVRRGQRVRAVYVAPDHANPSGMTMPLEQRIRLLEVAGRHGLLLLEDNAYTFTSSPQDELPSLKALDHDRRVILIGTFAKLCLPGARVGFVMADQQVGGSSEDGRLLADELAVLKTMVTVNTSPVGQAVIGGMLLHHGGSLRRLGNQRAAVYQRNLGLLLEALDRHLPASGHPGSTVSWNRPRGGFFVRMQLPIDVDQALLETSARDHAVLWTPMAAFHLGGGGDRELRLSCSYLNPAGIDEGVRRLAAFLAAVCPRHR